jgi:hypothetical protein
MTIRMTTFLHCRAIEAAPKFLFLYHILGIKALVQLVLVQQSLTLAVEYRNLLVPTAGVGKKLDPFLTIQPFGSSVSCHHNSSDTVQQEQHGKKRERLSYPFKLIPRVSLIRNHKVFHP